MVEFAGKQDVPGKVNVSELLICNCNVVNNLYAGRFLCWTYRIMWVLDKNVITVL